MEPPDETQTVHALSQTLHRLREPRFGILEIGIVIAIIVMLIAGLFTIATVIRQQRDVAETARNTNESVRILQRLVKQIQDAIDAAPAQTDRLLDRFAEELRRQIAAHDQRTSQIIVQEGKSHTQTVIVIVTPSPQPTATVTCDPTPVFGNCRRR